MKLVFAIFCLVLAISSAAHAWQVGEIYWTQPWRTRQLKHDHGATRMAVYGRYGWQIMDKITGHQIAAVTGGRKANSDFKVMSYLRYDEDGKDPGLKFGADPQITWKVTKIRGNIVRDDQQFTQVATIQATKGPFQDWYIDPAKNCLVKELVEITFTIHAQNFSDGK